MNLMRDAPPRLASFRVHQLLVRVDQVRDTDRVITEQIGHVRRVVTSEEDVGADGAPGPPGEENVPSISHSWSPIPLKFALAISLPSDGTGGP